MNKINIQITDEILEQMIEILAEASVSEFTEDGGFNLEQSECNDIATALIELQGYRELIKKHRAKKNAVA